MIMNLPLLCSNNITIVLMMLSYCSCISSSSSCYYMIIIKDQLSIFTLPPIYLHKAAPIESACTSLQF
jgi:hypothetical protein